VVSGGLALAVRGRQKLIRPRRYIRFVLFWHLADQQILEAKTNLGAEWPTQGQSRSKICPSLQDLPLEDRISDYHAPEADGTPVGVEQSEPIRPVSRLSAVVTRDQATRRTRHGDRRRTGPGTVTGDAQGPAR
jgi:hypothetical protein